MTATTYRNLAELHRRQAERYGPRTALRHKRHGLYHDLSWRHYREVSLACAAALAEAGIKPGDRVGMLSENRVEWLLADMGILAAAAVNVPAHAPLAPKQVLYQFAHAEIRWLFVSNKEQLAKVEQIRSELPVLEGIVMFDDPPSGDAMSWPAFLMRGRPALSRLSSELHEREAKLTGDDLATIMYTSGTTGNPKGVMLSHGNLLSNALSMAEDCGVNDESILLSWLPYSHIYARLVDHYLQLVVASTLCLAESQETLVKNLEEIQPTHLSSVPRFYEKVLALVSSNDPLVVARSPDRATSAETGRRLRRLFGPRIQWLNSGGAPLPLHVAQAFTDAGLCMLQGYGLTESSPVITFNRREHNKLGTVGTAVPGVEVRIAEDGELLTRGPHVMKGYWKDPAGTADAIHDGWLHTGDLAEIDAEGFVTITGRKKDLLVLSNGKKVVPAHIEGLLLADDCIDQVVIAGEGKNYLTALIVPHFENLRAAAYAKAIEEPDNGRLVQHPGVHALIAERVETALKDVSNWEKVRKFILLPRPFSLEADELTVSLKLRRGTILHKYRAALEALYAEP